MPVHDWSRVDAGILHHFHQAWIAELSRTLNSGLLPNGYYALAEQFAGPFGPDVLTLEADSTNDEPWEDGPTGSTAVAVKPPPTRIVATTEMGHYISKQNRVVVRHVSGDRIVALIEIVSPGNKSSRQALQSFIEKAGESIYRGYHLLIVDLQPPTPRDTQGIHGAVWSEITDDPYVAPPDKPLTVAAYSAGIVKTAYVEPLAIGDVLPEMPLFLDPESYISVPLEETYCAAWQLVPQRFRRVLEPKSMVGGSAP